MTSQSRMVYNLYMTTTTATDCAGTGNLVASLDSDLYSAECPTCRQSVGLNVDGDFLTIKAHSAARFLSRAFKPVETGRELIEA